MYIPIGLIKENAVHPEGYVSCLTAGHKTDKDCQPVKQVFLDGLSCRSSKNTCSKAGKTYPNNRAYCLRTYQHRHFFYNEIIIDINIKLIVNFWIDTGRAPVR